MPPQKGKPALDLPNLDETRKHRDNHPEIKPPVASSIRSKRKPQQKWDGRKVGDPGTTGQRSEIRDQRSANGSRGFHHPTKSKSLNRKSAALPPLLDDSYLQSFVVNALGRPINETELTYWRDILRSAYYRDPQSLILAAREMGRTIFESADYYHRSRSNHDYVYDLYETYLMRAPDQSGWDFWTTVCETNGRAAVRAAFDTCSEFYNLIGSLTPGDGVSGNPTSIASARMDPFNQSGDQIEARDCEWSLPLISLPGRAGLDLGLGVSYSSLVWTASGPYLYFDEDMSQLSPGFHLGFAAVQGPHYDALVGRKVYLLVTSAGRRVELRQVALPNVFEAADSSYLQLIENTGGTLTLRTADGTQINYSSYANDWQATRIKDRNGNYLTIDNDWRGDISTITDTLGRTLNFNSDGNGNLLSITQWRDGGWQSWATFGWDAPLTMNVTNLSGVVGTFPGDLIPVLRRVGLPDGSYYTFEYNGVGQVNAIGNYTYDNVRQNYTSYDYNGAPTECPRVTQSHLSGNNWTGINDLAAAVTTQFNLPGDGSHQMVMPDGTTYREYYGSGWQKGLVTKTEVYAPGLQKGTTTTYDQDNTGVNYPMNPRVTETNVYDSSGNHRRTTIDYDSYAMWGLPHVVHEYDGRGTELRRTYTRYELSQPYIDGRIIGLVAESDLYDPAQGWQSRTIFYYDSAGLSAQATYAPQHDPDYSSSGVTARGNLTHVERWDASDFGNGYKALTTKLVYDAAGSLLSTTDAAGHTNSIGYSDSFSDANNGRGTYAYPTTLTDADGNSSHVQYNFDFGAQTRREGPPPAGQSIGAVAHFHYDSAMRLDEIDNVNTGAATYFDYGPNYRRRWDSVNSVFDKYSVSYVDGLGRLITAVTALPNGNYAAQFTQYDLMGRVMNQSNPVEVTSSWVATADDAAGWRFNHATEYDWKGRPLHVYDMDGNFKTFEYTGCGCAGGEKVTITDEMSRQQRVYSDALGRQVKTEVLNGANVYATTTYTLNARDQVTKLQQTDNATGAYQDTIMSYDGYGRLQSRHVPEQRELNDNPAYTTYAYNNDDTVQAVTDARGASATYGYNSRHLVTSISYYAPSGVAASPNVTFGYDAAGNRTSMTDGFGSKAYSYNQLSQLVSETRTFSDPHNSAINGVAATLSYDYNLGGQLRKITDATGMTINYGYDGVGRLNGVTGSDNLYAGTSNYASNFQYRAWGGLKAMTDGTNHVSSLTYNLNLQPASFDISGGVVHQNYDYYSDGRIRFVHNTTDASFDRSYAYDHTGRLIDNRSGGYARGDGGPTPFFETFDYDAFSNLTGRNSDSWSSQVSLTDSAFYTNNRRDGWGYDADGRNTAIDTRTNTFDANGNQASMTAQKVLFNGHHVTVTENLGYDGDGARVYDAASGTISYYLRATVLAGAIIEELNGSGQKNIGYVYAPSGTQLATQFFGNVNWKLNTPMGTAQYNLSNNISAIGRTELDSLGADLSLMQPETPPPAEGRGDIGAGHFAGIMDSRFSDFFNISGGCTIGGLAASCSLTTAALNAGAATTGSMAMVRLTYQDGHTRLIVGETTLPGGIDVTFRGAAAVQAGIGFNIGSILSDGNFDSAVKRSIIGGMFYGSPDHSAGASFFGDPQNSQLSQQQNSARNLLGECSVRAMLDTISFSEHADYNTVVMGTVIRAPGHPELAGKTNVKVPDFSGHPNILVQAGRWASTAAGRYQFLNRTWNSLGLPDFGPFNQDIGAVMLMQRRGMITPLLDGDEQQAIENGNQEWASLPGSPYGQGTRTMNSLRRVYERSFLDCVRAMHEIHQGLGYNNGA